MAGRPTKYTPETVAKIVQAIELGATYELACNYAGIDYSTFARWKQKKSDFREILTRAEGNATVKWLAKIEQAANIDWRAAAWKLERRYTDAYGKTITEHTGKDGKPIQHEHKHYDFSMFNDEQIAALAEIAEEVESGARTP